MTIWFVTRHKGAVEWAKQEGIEVDRCVEHFDVNDVKKGDHVIGTLPVNLVFEVNKRGGRYFHLSINIPPEARGKELTANDMRLYGSQLQEYNVEEIK